MALSKTNISKSRGSSNGSRHPSTERQQNYKGETIWHKVRIMQMYYAGLMYPYIAIDTFDFTFATISDYPVIFG